MDTKTRPDTDVPEAVKTAAVQLVADVWTRDVQDAGDYIDRIAKLANGYGVTQYQVRLALSNAGMAHPNRSQFAMVRTSAMDLLRPVIFD